MEMHDRLPDSQQNTAGFEREPLLESPFKDSAQQLQLLNTDLGKAANVLHANEHLGSSDLSHRIGAANAHFPTSQPAVPRGSSFNNTHHDPAGTHGTSGWHGQGYQHHAVKEHSNKRGIALAGVRSWLKVLPDGSCSTVQLERHALERELGVQLRDFRVLDAVLGASYPACILVRPAALVVNLEHVKCLICQHYVLLNNSDVDRVRPLVELLKERLKLSDCQFTSTQNLADTGKAPDTSVNQPPISHAPMHATHQATNTSHLSSQSTGQLIDTGTHNQPGTAPPEQHGSGGITGLKTLPFELTVLEVCLEQVFHFLDIRASELDSSARQAVERMVARVTTKSLERMRQLKNKMTYLQKKVGTFKELLRKLLEDDKAMAGMNVSARQEYEELHRAALLRHHSTLARAGPATQQQLQPQQASAGLPNVSFLRNSFHDASTPRAFLAHRSLAVHTQHSLGLKVPTASEELTLEALQGLGQLPGSSEVGGAGLMAAGACDDLMMRVLEEGSAIVEMLLEAYYLQLDQTAGRLEACQQCIHDTEDTINIKLDQHRNYLISIDLMVSIASLVISACAVVTGVFGMNMPSGLENNSHSLFEVTGGMLIAAGLAWAGIIGISLKRGIITWVPWGQDEF